MCRARALLLVPKADKTRLTDAHDRLEKASAQKNDALAQASTARDALQAEVAALTATNADMASALSTQIEAA